MKAGCVIKSGDLPILQNQTSLESSLSHFWFMTLQKEKLQTVH